MSRSTGNNRGSIRRVAPIVLFGPFLTQEDEVMFIKFDDLDMLDFFENEPISIGEEGEAKFIYSVKDSHQFSMTLTVDTYAKKIDISVRYSNNTIFSGEFDNVYKIRKSEDVLLVEMENSKRLVLKKYSCLGVIIENV